MITKKEKQKLDRFHDTLKSERYMSVSRFRQLFGNPDNLSAEFFSLAYDFCDWREGEGGYGYYWSEEPNNGEQNLACFV